MCVCVCARRLAPIVHVHTGREARTARRRGQRSFRSVRFLPRDEARFGCGGCWFLFGAHVSYTMLGIYLHMYIVYVVLGAVCPSMRCISQANTTTEKEGEQERKKERKKKGRDILDASVISAASPSVFPSVLPSVCLSSVCLSVCRSVNRFAYVHETFSPLEQLLSTVLLYLPACPPARLPA